MTFGAEVIAKYLKYMYLVTLAVTFALGSNEKSGSLQLNLLYMSKDILTVNTRIYFLRIYTCKKKKKISFLNVIVRVLNLYCCIRRRSKSYENIVQHQIPAKNCKNYDLLSIFKYLTLNNFLVQGHR